MSAGEVWTHANGMRWVEIQAEPMEPSGWRLMVPLVHLDEAPDAPPLIVTLDDVRARVHLLTGAPAGELGESTGRLPSDDIATLQESARRLLGESLPLPTPAIGRARAERGDKLRVLDAMAEDETGLGLR